MKSTIRLAQTAVLLFAVSVLYAQDCNHLSFNKGASYEMESFDDKDKKTGMVKSVVKEVTTNGSKKEALLKSEIYNKKGEKENEGEVKIICDGNKLLLDISNFMQDNPMANNKDMEVKMEGAFLEMPSTLSVGQTLPEGKATMKMLDKKSGQEFAATTITIYNRKVVGKETITTPAGTFECYKVSYDTKAETKLAMGMSVPGFNSKGVDYISAAMGLTVKTQSYDKNGKLIGYQLLTKYSK